MVRAKFCDLEENKCDEIVDLVHGDSPEDVKDYVTGWLAERMKQVKEFKVVSDIDNLRRIAKNLSR